MTRLVLDQPGAVVHDAEAESILVAADDVTLVNPHVDGRWKTENRYGIQTGATREGFPYRRTRIIGGEVRNIWSKGLLVQFARVEGTLIEDVAQDGVMVGINGYVDLLDLTIRNLGLDAEGKGEGLDREGKSIHADGVQVVGGKWLRIMRCAITMSQGYEGSARVGNAGVYVESDFGDVHHLRIIGNRIDGPNHCIRIRDERWGYHVTDAVVKHNALIDPWSAYFIDETEEGVVYEQNVEEGSVRKFVT